jgi:hypothetical protein
MATEPISSVRTAGVTAGSTVAQSRSSAQRTTATSSGDKPRAKSSQTQSSSRQVINIDGKSFDSHAPRGTYINIVA